MKPCTRVGIDVTQRCNWKCQTCFYRYKDWFNTPNDKPLDEAIAELLKAVHRGCDHAVLVGQGETSLWPHLVEFINAARSADVSVSIITNGAVAIKRYEELFKAGINHLHISVHGTGDTLDDIAGVPGAGERQARTLAWLKSEGLPWRSNTTLQLRNYQELDRITDFILDHGAYHIVFLGFLPHYEWNDKLHLVAVPSPELRKTLEPAVRKVIDADRLTTIRYHPMCQLDPELRKYVVNARYVLYDPFEWEYGYLGRPAAEHWEIATKIIGGSVANQGAPCNACTHFMHCGGYNRLITAAFDGNGQEAITESINQEPGFLHDKNPANHNKGFL